MAHIGSIDLNLLAVFDAIVREKHVSRAAKELHLTQSAVSHSLTRLRDMFHDELFVRGPRGMLPTPKALELESEVRSILEKAGRLFEPERSFDPKTHEGIFQIITTDYFELVALPRLYDALAVKAPRVKVISRPTPNALPKSELESGQADIAVAGFYGEMPGGFYQQRLFTDDFVVLAKKNHPRLKNIKGKLSLAKYLEEDHIRISLQGNLKGELDRNLEKKGIQRNVVAGLSNFTSPAWVLCETEMLLTAPRKLAERYAAYLPLQILSCPLEISTLSVMQVWHARTQDDPFRKWMRAQSKELFA